MDQTSGAVEPVQQVALHTVLHEGAGPAYDEVHARVPRELAEALTRAGVRDWRIWRDGTDLFHLVEVTDYVAMRRALAEDPVNAAWQQQVAPLLAVPDDYSGADAGPARVWSLAEQLAAHPQD